MTPTSSPAGRDRQREEEADPLSSPAGEAQWDNASEAQRAKWMKNMQEGHNTTGSQALPSALVCRADASDDTRALWGRNISAGMNNPKTKAAMRRNGLAQAAREEAADPGGRSKRVQSSGQRV